MSRRFVSEHAGQFPIKRLCKLVGVARSTFYESWNRPLSAHDLDDVALTDEIYEIHVADSTLRHQRSATRRVLPR